MGHGVKGFVQGDRVALSLFAAGLGVGGYAELVAADARYKRTSAGDLLSTPPR